MFYLHPGSQVLSGLPPGIGSDPRSRGSLGPSVTFLNTLSPSPQKKQVLVPVRAEARLLSSLSPTGGPSLLLVPPLPRQHAGPLPLPVCPDPARASGKPASRPSHQAFLKTHGTVPSGQALCECGVSPCSWEPGVPRHGLRSNHKGGRG